jgi:hypothetical protein
VAERFDLRKISNAVAFISRRQDPHQKSGFSRVVVITEENAGHFNQNPIYHAFQVRKVPPLYNTLTNFIVSQCLESSPEDLVEMVQSAKAPPPQLDRGMSRNSIDMNWINSGTGSVRSATVRRGSPSIIPQQVGHQ